MAENMMNSNHKATNKKFRDNYDKTFGNKKKVLVSKSKDPYGFSWEPADKSELKDKFCECGAPAVAYLPTAKRYVCDSNWRQCPTYRAKLRECHRTNKKESPFQKFKREVSEGKYKCVYCGETAKTLVAGDKPCCSDKSTCCPNYHEWLSAVHKKRYDENPEFKKMMRDKLAEVQKRPEVIEKKRQAMKTLHSGDCIPCVEFQENYKESVKNKKEKWYKRHYDNLIAYGVAPEDIPDDYEERASLVNTMRSNAKRWMNASVKIESEVNHE